MMYAIIGLVIGAIIGFLLPLSIPAVYAKYTSVALLAIMDTIFGGLRSKLEHSFDRSVFVIGFFTNALLAAVLVFIGDLLGIDLYFVALITFGIRIFNNVASIRTLLINRYRIKKARVVEKEEKT